MSDSKQDHMFIKFQFGDSVKKVRVTRDELNWNSICKILEKSFYLSDKKKIALTYKDLEDDEITVNSDQDLAEAYDLYFSKKLAKFFVFYSGVFDDPKQTQLIDSTKIQSKEEQIEDDENLEIDSKELSDIFSEVFSRTEIIQLVRERLSKYIHNGKKGKEGEIVEYNIDTDFGSLSKEMVKTLGGIMGMKLSGSKKSEEKPEKASLDKTSYENVTKTTILKENKPEDIEKSSTNLEESKSPSKNSVSKDLTSSYGVKLVLKYENGKARFVSVPSDDLAETQYVFSNESEMKKANQKTEEDVEIENLEESVNNIVVNLKRTSSKDQRNKQYEFEEKLLQSNKHDLDDDLPAPYDHNKVKKN